MSEKEFSEFEIARIRKLATELGEKMARYFLEPAQDDRIAELKAIRTQLERMGFLVTWRATINPETSKMGVDVSLFLPKTLTEEEWTKAMSELPPETVEWIQKLREAANRLPKQSP